MKSTGTYLEISRGRRFFAAAVCTLLFLPIGSFAQTPGRQQLRGHVPHAVASAHRMSELQAGLHLDLTISLPLRNQAELDALLQQLYDPASPQFRHYLTPDQFTARFGPSESDYRAVIDFAEANGLQVTRTFAGRALLRVNGSVAGIERTFHVNLYNYQRPDGTAFYAPDREPSIDLDVPILRVKHLDNATPPRRAGLQRMALPADGTGSGTGGCFMAADLRAAYVPNVALDGRGQSVAVIEASDFYDNDVTTYFDNNGITAYRNDAGLPANPTQRVPVGSYDPPTNLDEEGEAVADIQVATAMAPGLDYLSVYMGEDLDSDLAQIAQDDAAKQLSISYVFSPEDSLLQRFAAQGQSVFAASGDSGYYVAGAADSPWVTGTGGTMLTTTGPCGSALLPTGSCGAWVSESAWWNPGGSWYGSDGDGSSGGVSTSTSILWWQQGIDMSMNGGSTTMRNIPDVAMVAFNICSVATAKTATGSIYQFSGGQGGTSFAAPLWAGFTALVNQQAAQKGLPAFGLPNLSIYAIAKGPNYHQDFHDTVSGCTPAHCALSGYDLVTGWGTPTGQNLINELTSPPVTVFVSPPGPVSLNSGGSQTLTAEVMGASDTTIGSWTLSPQVGTLSVSGGQTAVYNAPANITTPQTVTVTACSAAAPARCGSALMTLAIAVVISPSSVNLYAGGSQTFTVSVPGGRNSAIGSWTVSPQVGTLQVMAQMGQQAIYTAPSTITAQQTVTLTACLASYLSQCATATVNLWPRLSPTAATLYAGGSQTFTVSVPGGGNSAVGSWAYSPKVGTLQVMAQMGQQAIYTAPSTVTAQQTVTLTACLASNLSQCATATVTLVPPVVISPSSVNLYAGGSQTFNVTLPYQGNSTIGSWTVSPQVGTLRVMAQSGQQAVYTAPSTIAAQQTVTLTACLASNLNQCGTATVNLWPRVSPVAATLYAGGSQIFTVSVLGGGNSAANWTLSPSVGQLSPPTGQQVTYTAPSSITAPQTVTLAACLISNLSQCGTATVILMPQVLISPSSVTLLPGGSQMFTVTLPNGGNSTIGSWAYSPKVGNLQVMAQMGQQAIYTAPSTITAQQTVTLTACLASNLSQCGTATVTLVPVAISPSSVVLNAGGSQTFTVSVPKGASSAVGSWTLSPQVGTLQWITPTGQQVIYYAPAAITTPQTVTLTACLASNLRQCGTATVTLLISPSAVTLYADGSQVFTANQAVLSWTLSPVVGKLGQPTPQQVTYYAPSSITTPQTVTLTACLASNLRQCGTATVTLLISPSAVTLHGGGSQMFTVTLPNGGNSAIGSWTVSPKVGLCR